MLLLLCLVATLGRGAVIVTPDKTVIMRLRAEGYLTHYIEEPHLGQDDLVPLVARSVDTTEEIAPGLRLGGGARHSVLFNRDLIQRRLKNSRTVINYLDDFGYLDAYLSDKGDLPIESAEMGGIIMMDMMDIEGALKLFQRLNELPETGLVDLDVLNLMKIPRCGVPDTGRDFTHPAGEKSESQYLVHGDSLVHMGYTYSELEEQSNGELVVLDKRYEVSDEKWHKTGLSFYIENYSDTLDQFTKTEIVRAFEVWTREVSITLYEVTDVRVADIRIKFVSKYHGDKYPFDGALGVLAHAFYPRSGEIHFDNDEEFTRNSERGVNLYYTAAHEFGHTLGLKHSLNKRSLMSPYHPGLQAQIRLHEDDLRGIVKLYEAGTGAVYTSDHPAAQEFERALLAAHFTSQDSKPQVEDSSCITKVDAAIHHPSTRTLFFFSGEVFYKVERNRHGEVGVMEGYPKRISEGWDGLEGNLDAAFVNSSLKAAFFFKGDRYWRYSFNTNKILSGYPMPTPANIPRQLKAVMSSGKTTYFFGQNGGFKHDRTSDELSEIAGGNLDIQASFPLFVKGYFATTHGPYYSIYKVRNLEALMVYHGRPLAWDYGLPTCTGDLYSGPFNPKMKRLCDAYAMLASSEINLNVPTECYGMVKPFLAKPLEDILEDGF